MTKSIGKWELVCVTFNICIYKMFTSYPSVFGRISANAGWLTALYTGIIFLAITAILLFVFGKYKKKLSGGMTGKLLRAASAVYWIFSAAYTLREFTETAKTVSYTNTPVIIIAFFFLLGAVVAAACGAKAVYRLHSLTEVFIAVVMAAIALLGFKYANLDYLFPILGNGAKAVFVNGLSSLFLYADIIFIIPLAFHCRSDVKPSAVVLSSAAAAVLLNVILMLSVCTANYSNISIPIYPLTKMAYFGRFWSRLDSLYLIAFICSGMLYLSLALHMISLCIGKKPFKFKIKPTAGIFMCIAVCICLTGCYDSREVEESAYLIALGIDRSENNMYNYTFQLSNPLELGNNSDFGEMNDSENDNSGKEQNKGVNNITVSADDFYSALDTLRSGLGKEPELTHLILIVFSKELAAEGLRKHTSLLYKERETRPGIKLCLADSAEEFLTGIKPQLEQSTARYYELLFNPKNIPYAPITELWAYVSDSNSSDCAAVIPIADNGQIMGMGIFSQDKMIAEAGAYDAMIYKLLTGKSKNITISAGNSAFMLNSAAAPRIILDSDGKSALIENRLNAKVIYGDLNDSNTLREKLDSDIKDFLAKYISHESADILGIRRKLKKNSVDLTDWNTKTDSFQHENLEIYSKNIIKIQANCQIELK